jgi:hypothetical protein
MNMRAILRLICAALLGGFCALLISCGGAGKGLIPSANAGPLQADFAEVAAAAQAGNGDCARTEAALAKTEQDFQTLPASVDRALRTRLRQGIANLHDRALALCAQPLPSSTNTTPLRTPPSTTTTQTTTTATTPTTPTTTTTTPSSPISPGQGGGTVAPGESEESEHAGAHGHAEGNERGDGAGGVEPRGGQ